MTIISRAATDFAVSGRTLEGIAYKYGRPADVTDDEITRYYEQMLHGCDTKSIRDRAGGTFDVLVWHSRSTNRGQFPPEDIGQVSFHPTDEHLEFEASIKKSYVADEVLELVADETARDVSIGYKIMHDIEGVHAGSRLVSRAEVALRELSICPTGTGMHDDAEVLVMRAASGAFIPASVDARLRLLNL